MLVRAASKYRPVKQFLLSVCVNFFSLQYFNSSGPNFDSSVAPRLGGSLSVPDYCPFQIDVVVNIMFVCTTRLGNQFSDSQIHSYLPSRMAV